jgi:hypothetical protein
MVISEILLSSAPWLQKHSFYHLQENMKMEGKAVSPRTLPAFSSSRFFAASSLCWRMRLNRSA